MASKMKENLRKNMHRITQVASQTVGRAEKTQVLNEVHESLESRIDHMTGALKHTRIALGECLRTRSKEDNVDKRRKKVGEHELVQSLEMDSKELLESSPEARLLGSVMGLYGQASSAVLDELVQTDLDIEKRVLERLGKFAEDEKNVNHLREKLRKAVLDMDSAKTRLQARQQSGERLEQVQDELDSAQSKVETFKDALVTDLYMLAGKEVEMANIFSVLVEIQMEYHRTAAKTLENLLPQITKKIAMYDRRPVFGCPLQDHLRYSNREIALVIEVCCCALVDLGLAEEGLFRISGNATKVRKLKAGFDAGEIDLTDYDRDPHSIAGALKSYLRELPEPLMTHNLYKDWTTAGNAEGQQRKELVRECLSVMPRANLLNLRYLVKFLAKMLEHEKETKMSASNLAIVMGPNMIWSPADGDNFLGSRLVECLVTNAEYFFPGEISFTSNLIGSLHDRDGGFDAEVNSPLTSVLGKLTVGAMQENARKSPPEKHTTPPGGQNRNVNSSPSGPSAGAKPRIAPVLQKRPKEKAPPPPPLPKTGTNPPPQRWFSGQEGISELVAEIPSGPPSKSSSLNDSLNEYGSETEPEFYATVAPDDPEIREESRADVGRFHSFSPDPGHVYASVEDLEGPGQKGHRKTNSLDRPPPKPTRAGAVSVLPAGSGSLERPGKKPGRFPNESDLDKMLLTGENKQRKSVVLVEDSSGNSEGSRWTPVVQQHPQSPLPQVRGFDRQFSWWAGGLRSRCRSTSDLRGPLTRSASPPLNWRSKPLTCSIVDLNLRNDLKAGAVSVLPAGSGSLERPGKKPGRFPNESDLDKMLLTGENKQRKSVVLVEDSSGNSEGSRWTPVVQQHPQSPLPQVRGFDRQFSWWAGGLRSRCRSTSDLRGPLTRSASPPLNWRSKPLTCSIVDLNLRNDLKYDFWFQVVWGTGFDEDHRNEPNRPPPPKKENLEKNSILRSSLRKTEEKEEKETKPIYPVLTEGAARPSAAPRRANAAAATVEVTNVVVNGNTGPSSPESPKQKPPLPAKPKQMESENWSMTRL